MTESLTEPLFRHILVPTDGSAEANQAARVALRVARACHARVTVLYVIDTVVLDELARFAEPTQAAQTHSTARQEMWQTGDHYLADLEQLAHQANLEVQREIREGEPYAEIVSAATQLGVDLITMGHVGRRGPRRILIGSVTERVIEFAPCPVLVVKESPPHTAP